MAGKYLDMYTAAIEPPPGWTHFAYTDNGYYDYGETLDGLRVHHDDDPEDYEPDVKLNRALQFLRQTPPSRPVFAWITPFAVHATLDPVSGRYSPYPDIAPRFATDPACDGLGRWVTPAHADSNADRPLYQRAWDKMREGYDLVQACRALLSVDQGLVVADELRRQGRLDHTLLLFTSDNGMGWGAHGYPTKDVTFSTPMPLLLWWSDVRGPHPALDRTLLSTVDLAPTLCAVAGCVMGPTRTAGPSLTARASCPSSAAPGGWSGTRSTPRTGRPGCPGGPSARPPIRRSACGTTRSTRPASGSCTTRRGVPAGPGIAASRATHAS